jgi:hypothetical protein
VNAAAQEAGFPRHQPFTLTAMASGSSHKIHVDPRALYGLTSQQQKKIKDPVQAVLSAERFAELNEIILQTHLSSQCRPHHHHELQTRPR